MSPPFIIKQKKKQIDVLINVKEKLLNYGKTRPTENSENNYV